MRGSRGNTSAVAPDKSSVPLRVRVAEERQAIALAQELIGIVRLDVYPENGAWEVALECGKTDRVLVRVLDAVRRTLAGEPTASALVLLDGRGPHMEGE
jgi:hypothetical protein